MRSYLEATVPRRVARIAQTLATDYSSFWTIELWSRVKLEDFNSASFSWEPYFSDTGRALAAGEQAFLQEAVQKQVEVDAETIARSDPQFSVLERRVEALSKGDFPPDSLLAPIEVYVPFIQHFYRSMKWDNHPRVVIAGTALNIVWSHKYAPSACFVMFSSKAGTWHVVPNAETGLALSIAIGQSALYPDNAEIGAETVVKYEVTRPDAFSRIQIG